jgi:hypothetical protein
MSIELITQDIATSPTSKNYKLTTMLIIESVLSFARTNVSCDKCNILFQSSVSVMFPFQDHSRRDLHPTQQAQTYGSLPQAKESPPPSSPAVHKPTNSPYRNPHFTFTSANPQPPSEISPSLTE